MHILYIYIHCTCIYYAVTVGMVAGSLRLPVKDGADKSGIFVTLSDVIEGVPLTVRGT